MAKTKQQKQEITARLEEALKTAASSVFVSFTRMTVADETELRKGLREAGVKYFVAKKTLIARALRSLGHADAPQMPGEIAVAYNAAGGDASAPARLVYEFSQKLKDKLAIAGGIFEGVVRDALAMNEIATIPSMEVLRGRLANVINSPIQRLAIVMNEVAKTKTA